MIWIALPASVVLVLLVIHSFRSLPPWRAAACWGGVALYGILRGVGVRLVAQTGLGGMAPYVIHEPVLTVGGVSLLEIAGWGVAVWLGWWLGARFSSRLFAQILWAGLTLACLAWAIESAAIAAGWWHWTVPLSRGLLLDVPLIGLVDWFFVAIDFLLPFVLLTDPRMRGRPARFLSLGLFPLHFLSHLFVQRAAGFLPVPLFHLAHWALGGTLVWLAIRSRLAGTVFAPGGSRLVRLLPVAALAIVLADVALVDLLVARRPSLVVTILPAAVTALLALIPPAGVVVGLVAAAGGPWLPSALLAAVPAGAALILRAPGRRWQAGLAVVALAAVAYGSHTMAARREADLLAALDRAIAARDRGDLESAARHLEEARATGAVSHAPSALLAEIRYRQGRLEEARRGYLDAVSIRQDFLDGYRHLAVIALRAGDADGARREARRGLAIDPDDASLRLLLGKADGGTAVSIEPRSPAEARSLVSLAYEIGDTAEAVSMLDRFLARWPAEGWFYRTRINLALAGGDEAAARRVAALWAQRLPGDPEAAQAATRLGAGHE